MTTWVSGGYGFWRGSLWWLWVFFFFGCDRCLKGLGVVVGSGVWVVGRGWVMVGLWLKWVIGHGSTKSHTTSLSSLIMDRRAGFGSVDGGFKMVDLLISGWIGWVDHR